MGGVAAPPRKLRCSVHRRHGRGSYHGSTALLRRIAHRCMAVALDLGGWDKKAQIEKRKIQTSPTASCIASETALRFLPSNVAEVLAMPSSFDLALDYSPRPSCCPLPPLLLTALVRSGRARSLLLGSAATKKPPSFWIIPPPSPRPNPVPGFLP